MKQNRFVTAKNARAVALALLLFVYPIIVLSFASIRYTETIHRISTSHTFDQSLFGSIAADSLAAVGFMALFTGLASKTTAARVGSVAAFAAGIALYLASPGILQLAGIASLPSMVALLASMAFANRNKTVSTESRLFHFGKEELYRVGSALLVIIIILEIGALGKWVTHPFFPSEIYSEGDPSWRFAELESALFHSLGLLSPYLVALIAFSFFYKWFLAFVFRRITNVAQSSQMISEKRAQAPIERQQPTDNGQKEKQWHDDKSTQAKSQFQSEASGGAGPVVATFSTNVRTSTISRNAHWMILSAALIIAPLVIMYPHLPGVNPERSGVSTDEQYYMNWMSILRTNSGGTWTDALTDAFTINKGDRPLTLLFILTIANLTGSPDLMVIRFLPVALAPALVLANYVLIRYSLKSKETARVRIYASIGAVFAALSPQIVVGQYAGFLANWLALIAAYFAILFTIKGWESQTQKQLISSFGILFAILLVMMLVHVYTWAHLLTVLFLYAGVSYIFARKSVSSPKIKLVMLLVIIVATFSIDYAKSSYFSTPAAAESDSSLAENILPQDTSARWDRLIFTMGSYVGGYLSNPVLLLLGLVWMVRADLSKGLDRSLLAMLFILALPVAIGSIEFQTRVFYNVPFQIPALLALYGITVGRWNAHSYLVAAVALVLATYALRAMASLYLNLPDGFVLDDQFLLP